MTTRIVTTQEALDEALANDGVTRVIINSDPGIWLEIRGNSRVDAWGDSRVNAWDNSHVNARDNSHVNARDNSHVNARDNSHVNARDNSCVNTWDNSCVDAWGNSDINAWGDSRVYARGNSDVHAWGDSHVNTWGDSHVNAGKYVTVHRHSGTATAPGRTLIDMPKIDLTNPNTWADYHGLNVDGDNVIVYKAVDADLTAGHSYTPTEYPIGQDIVALDWRADGTFGGGLHFGPSPRSAARYYRGGSKPRYLACSVALAEMIPLKDKVKAKACRVLYEVDAYGERLTAES